MWTMAIVVYVTVTLLVMFVAGVGGIDHTLWLAFMWPVIAVAVVVVLPFLGMNELGLWIRRKRGY